MPTRFTRTGIAALAAFAAGVAVLLSGCGDDGDDVTQHEAPASPTSDAGGGASISSVAPDTFLTFEGARYRLVELQQAELIDDSVFEEAGVATEADIDQEDLSVYRKPGDDDAVYTFAPGVAEPLDGAGSEGGATPVWYRWTLEP